MLALADRLREEGVDARLDQYIDSPSQGWPRWSQQQLLECEFVLIVCTPTYRECFEREGTGALRRGVRWEAMIIQQLLYEAGTQNDKLVPVWFEDGEEKDVPLALRAHARHRLPGEYEKLYRQLTRQPEIVAPPIGAIRTTSEVAMAAITDDTLVDELAKVFCDEGHARIVAQRAGFASGLIPGFGMPLVFWTMLVAAARNGAISGGVNALAESAARLFPENAIFRGYRQRA